MTTALAAPLPLPAAPPAAAVATADDDAPTQGLHVLAAYGTLITGVLQAKLPAMMEATGIPGAVIVGVAFLPIYWRAVLAGAAPFRDGPLRVLALLVVMLGLSPAWGDHPQDGLVKAAAAATALAWGALLWRWPALLRTVLMTGLAYALVGQAAALAGVEEIPPANCSFLVVVMLAAATQWRSGSGRRLLGRILRVLAFVALVALVFLSTFRAPTIGVLLVLAALAVRVREARWALVLLALLGGAFFSLKENTQGPSYARTVERDDLVGRYENISSDRLSGRTDIWEGITAHLVEHPGVLAIGGGLGDVDFIVADANPRLGAVNRRGERVLSTHNLALEILISNGIPGFVVLLWLVGSMARRAFGSLPDAGMFACVVVLSGSNVPLVDAAGGTLLVGLLCAQLGRRTPWRMPGGVFV